jgi:hypothetical protein
MSSTSFLFVQINDFYHIDYLLDSANPRSMIFTSPGDTADQSKKAGDGCQGGSSVLLPPR